MTIWEPMLLLLHRVIRGTVVVVERHDGFRFQMLAFDYWDILYSCDS